MIGRPLTWVRISTASSLSISMTVPSQVTEQPRLRRAMEFAPRAFDRGLRFRSVVHTQSMEESP